MRAFLLICLVILASCGCHKESTVSTSANLNNISGPADRVVIEKTRHQLTLIKDGKPIASFRVALGRGGLQPKEKQGDHRTPEGMYSVDGRKPNSRFYRALHVSYPNEADRQRAANAGVSPGSDIEIHGIENGLGWIRSAHTARDWTDGCIAVTDKEMDEIWRLVPLGTPIEIRH